MPGGFREVLLLYGGFREVLPLYEEYRGVLPLCGGLGGSSRCGVRGVWETQRPCSLSWGLGETVSGVGTWVHRECRM